MLPGLVGFGGEGIWKKRKEKKKDWPCTDVSFCYNEHFCWMKRDNFAGICRLGAHARNYCVLHVRLSHVLFLTQSSTGVSVWSLTPKLWDNMCCRAEQFVTEYVSWCESKLYVFSTTIVLRWPYAVDRTLKSTYKLTWLPTPPFSPAELRVLDWRECLNVLLPYCQSWRRVSTVRMIPHLVCSLNNTTVVIIDDVHGWFGRDSYERRRISTQRRVRLMIVRKIIDQKYKLSFYFMFFLARLNVM